VPQGSYCFFLFMALEETVVPSLSFPSGLFYARGTPSTPRRSERLVGRNRHRGCLLKAFFFGRGFILLRIGGDSLDLARRTFRSRLLFFHGRISARFFSFKPA